MLFQLDLLLRIVIAAFCGATIGYERTQRLKAAGIRTHILVAAASALFLIVSKYGFNDILAQNNISFDPSRIGAQVVSGISFIGAGTILIRHQSINGLTTAAGIWITSGIGMALGSGLYFIGIVSTILIVTIQYFLRNDRLFSSLHMSEAIKVLIQAEYTNTIQQEITQTFISHHVKQVQIQILKIDNETITLNVTGKIMVRKHYNHNDLLEDLIHQKAILSVR
ncbi:MgtC/SapB family protein [Staphylococcus sp. IVB6181]|uniref:MgtC/SapB family protein n=1 Tax=Staphylococcus sp. IVB6181 TaxID=2929481 RepID=UPI0021D03DC4|nr:MgtC/SapB family protein [Staphylococcus sp. IVB6181]UXV35740.1 MgtC/SapB family protein [Staphylococcus sp. IVB6181]